MQAELENCSLWVNCFDHPRSCNCSHFQFAYLHELISISNSLISTYVVKKRYALTAHLSYSCKCCRYDLYIWYQHEWKTLTRITLNVGWNHVRRRVQCISGWSLHRIVEAWLCRKRRSNGMVAWIVVIPRSCPIMRMLKCSGNINMKILM